MNEWMNLAPHSPLSPAFHTNFHFSFRFFWVPVPVELPFQWKCIYRETATPRRQVSFSPFHDSVYYPVVLEFLFLILASPLHSCLLASEFLNSHLERPMPYEFLLWRPRSRGQGNTPWKAGTYLELHSEGLSLVCGFHMPCSLGRIIQLLSFPTCYTEMVRVPKSWRLKELMLERA